MPEDPQNPMEAEFEGSVGAKKVEPQTGGIAGDVDFLTALRRPGANPNHPWGADLLKILAQGGSGAPGGLPGMAFNFASLAANPSSLRPLLGAGNATELATGMLPAGLRKIPAVEKMAESLPRTFGAITGALGGGGVAAADTFDRGADPSTAGKIGGVLGALTGTAGSHFHQMANRLPSPVAERIDSELRQISGAPAKAPAKIREAGELLGALAAVPGEKNIAQAAARTGEEQGALAGLFTRMADKFRPTVKGSQTAAAEAKARFQNAGVLTGIAENSDIDAAKDFLKIDYRKELFDLSSQMRELESKYTGPSRNLPWFKKRSAELQGRLTDLQTRAQEATELTRRTEAAASKATTSTLNAEASGGQLAKDARSAAMQAAKQSGRLGALESAATGAEISGIKAATQQELADQNIRKIFANTGVRETGMTPEADKFLASIAPHKDSITLHDSLSIAMKNPEKAAGLRQILELRDPKMLASARGSLLSDVFEKARIGKGGKGDYPQIYDGNKLADEVDGLPTASINAFFDNPKAHQDLRELAQAAKDATKLADFHKFAGGVGSIGATAAGATVMHSMGRSVTDPLTGALLITTAAGGLAVVNVPKFIEANIQSNGLLGNMMTEYIKSKNPEKLPMAVTSALSKFVVSRKYKNPEAQQNKKRYDLY